MRTCEVVVAVVAALLWLSSSLVLPLLLLSLVLAVLDVTTSDKSSRCRWWWERRSMTATTSLVRMLSSAVMVMLVVLHVTLSGHQQQQQQHQQHLFHHHACPFFVDAAITTTSTMKQLSCQPPNPLVTDPLTLFNNMTVPLSDLPVPVRDADFLSRCSNLANSVSCCRSEADAFFRDKFAAFDRFRENLDRLARTLNETRLYAWLIGASDVHDLLPLPYSSTFVPPSSSHSSSHPPPPPPPLPSKLVPNDAQLTALRQIIPILVQWANFSVPCWDSMLGYLQGMTCFACDPDYAQYVYDNTTSSSSWTTSSFDSVGPAFVCSNCSRVLRISWHTCSAVYEKCQPAFLSVLRNVRGLTDAVLNLTGASNMTMAQYLRLDSAAHTVLSSVSASVCDIGGSCQSYFCSAVLVGMYVRFDELPADFAALSDYLATVRDVFSQWAAGLSSAVTSSEVEVVPLSSSLRSPPIATPLFSSYGATTSTSTRCPSNADASDACANGLANPTWNVSCAHSGFDAYAIGCRLDVSKYACYMPGPPTPDSPASTLPTHMYFLFAFSGSIAVLCVLSCCFYQRHRRRRSDEAGAQTSLLAWMTEADRASRWHHRPSDASVNGGVFGGAGGGGSNSGRSTARGGRSGSDAHGIMSSNSGVYSDGFLSDSFTYS